jgi:putative ABC transport system ATP-binding protein
VEIRNLHRRYRLGNVHALRGISLRVNGGEFIAIKGRSGSGKTTLLNIAGGLDSSYEGIVLLNGNDISRLSENETMQLRRSEIGFVFQSFGLLPHYSAFETVEFALRLSGISRKARYERAEECLAMVGLSERANHRPYELSGGQQQRLCIARAIAIRPNLILADEPTGELDSNTGRDILSLFRQIVALQEVALLVATHDPLIHDYAEKVYELSDGQLTELL